MMDVRVMRMGVCQRFVDVWVQMGLTRRVARLVVVTVMQVVGVRVAV